MFKIGLFLLGIACVNVNAQDLDHKQARTEYVNRLCKECPELNARLQSLAEKSTNAESIVFYEVLLANEKAVKKYPNFSQAIEYTDDFEKCCIAKIRATEVSGVLISLIKGLGIGIGCGIRHPLLLWDKLKN